MNAHLIPSHFRSSLVAGALALVAPSFAIAADSTAAAVVYVKVFHDHYAVNEQWLADAVVLEAALQPIGDRVLRLDNCGQKATPALLAAVERLYLAHAGVIEIRPLPAGDQACSSANDWPVSERGVSAVSKDAAYLATDSFGRSIMP